ncbi:hypothetical protein [Chitinimonas koreensis]|uniref:hypothetical protein n=1 Tax=Chitinimonas koreensis TaxID=356302 RepID=UPI0004284B71|nr:hypothetical protein [Chitinimonas koreensis]QNM98115.1 hypothetical protein H9L41_07645 [Chitinimonas koreensis]
MEYPVRNFAVAPAGHRSGAALALVLAFDDGEHLALWSENQLGFLRRVLSGYEHYLHANGILEPIEAIVRALANEMPLEREFELPPIEVEDICSVVARDHHLHLVVQYRNSRRQDHLVLSPELGAYLLTCIEAEEADAPAVLRRGSTLALLAGLSTAEYPGKSATRSRRVMRLA